MSPQELENQLHTLTAIQKAIAVQTLTQSLNNGSRGITKTDGICGGAACLFRTRIPIWLLVESRRQGISEAQLLNDYPHLVPPILSLPGLMQKPILKKLKLLFNKMRLINLWQGCIQMNNFHEK
jgi:uncharacterized protein (DUF433 family)